MSKKILIGILIGILVAGVVLIGGFLYFHLFFNCVGEMQEIKPGQHCCFGLKAQRISIPVISNKPQFYCVPPKMEESIKKSNSVQFLEEKSVFKSNTYRYIVEYPSTWYFHNLGEKMDTFYISNVSSNQYHHGGILPAGGAEIFIKVISIPLLEQSLSEFITKELKRTIILSKENIQVNGIKAIKVVYLWEIGPDSFYKNVVVYFSVDKKIYKILLSFRKDDPKESYFMHVFDSVISSFHFI